MTFKAIASIIMLAVLVFFFAVVIPHWGQATGKKAATVDAMNTCIKEQSIKVHGQDAIDSAYRLCWMHAVTDASK